MTVDDDDDDVTQSFAILFCSLKLGQMHSRGQRWFFFCYLIVEIYWWNIATQYLGIGIDQTKWDIQIDRYNIY